MTQPTPSKTPRGGVKAPAEILPCPKCKSPGAMAHKQGSWGYYPGYYWVECTGPDCAVVSRSFEDERWTEGKGTKQIDDEAKASAIKDWNRRS